MESNTDRLMWLFGGLVIFADKNQKALADANNHYFVHP